MKANYGYKDGSGDFFISVDTDLCTGCGLCVEACPCGVMVVGEDENDPFSDDEVASVCDGERKKIKYTCAPCKGEGKIEPCVGACGPGAIKHSW